MLVSSTILGTALTTLMFASNVLAFGVEGPESRPALIAPDIEATIGTNQPYAKGGDKISLPQNIGGQQNPPDAAIHLFGRHRGHGGKRRYRGRGRKHRYHSDRGTAAAFRNVDYRSGARGPTAMTPGFH
jgi:hypothetical protein